jgi:glycerol-3-phosphate acyltransferase PlsX
MSNSATAGAPTIAVDAMGGDHGPAVTVPGALAAARGENGEPCRIVLVGKRDALEAELARHDVPETVEVVDAAQVVTMEDKPSEVLRRKKDSSIQVACRLVKDGRADGVVSAGNTGATLACGMFILGRIKGIERPGLASILPTEKGRMVLVDVGANVDCKPRHLFQFGLMANVLARCVLEMDTPRVGILSIGEEEGKGSTQVRDAYEMLRSSPLNFVGNVEGREIFEGDIDILVCDGFVGNIILKLSEGLAQSLSRMLKSHLTEDIVSQLGAFIARGAFKRFKRFVDYAEYGGAPLLGLKSIALVCHGASNARAIGSAVQMAATFVRTRANDQLIAGLDQVEDIMSTAGGRPKAVASGC